MTSRLHPDIEKAYTVLDTGVTIDYDLASALGRLPNSEVLDLVSLANKVRNRYAGDRAVHTCSIINAKSGRCSENCSFCAQSSHNHATIDVYGLVDESAVLAAAREAYDQGVRHFGIVTSGYGYTRNTPEFTRVLGMIDLLQRELPDMGVCADLGMIGDEQADALAERGILHFNMNLQVNPARYGELIADTHTVDERIETIRRLRARGISVCSGGIIGTGESMQDRIDLMFRLRELDVDVVPINVLVPIKGTRLEEREGLPVPEIAKTFAICRLVHPDRIVKFAAGRETLMKDFQGLLMLAGANGFLTGGYLTTRGRDTASDRVLAEQIAMFA